MCFGGVERACASINSTVEKGKACIAGITLEVPVGVEQCRGSTSKSIQYEMSVEEAELLLGDLQTMLARIKSFQETGTF